MIGFQQQSHLCCVLGVDGIKVRGVLMGIKVRGVLMGIKVRSSE